MTNQLGLDIVKGPWMTAQALFEKRTSTDISNIDNAQEENLDIKPKNPHAVALGRLGGKKGGKARAAKLTAEERSAIARKAAKTRWNRERSEP
ncbi:MAG: hypothetical protein IID05_03185 [Gemmatimonadetes bacterium]|nr:hypothetical protein [Gemmatimonadota bacterium]